MARRASTAVACVIGDTDLVRPLALDGVRCAVMAERGAPVRYSRFVMTRIEFADPWEDTAGVVDNLVAFARTQVERPVLFYQGDGELIAVSRHRRALEPWFRFVIPGAELVEDLVDKARFQALAARLALPVPPAVLIDPVSGASPLDMGLRFPVILKPIVRDSGRWVPVAGSAKAVRVDSRRDMRDRWRSLASVGIPILAQELVSGPESRIESYHVYVDTGGEIVADFTGVKIRTHPAAFGHSTAVEITATPDVLDTGRRVVLALGLRGVAKVDFKRSPTGELVLLEVNPRFNLWHHPGAVAGVNLPALVYNDLTGRPRPAVACRPGVSWCKAWRDLPAARSAGVPLRRWVSWAWRADTKRDIAWDDPGPIVGAAVSFLRRRATTRTESGRQAVRAA